VPTPCAPNLDPENRRSAEIKRIKELTLSFFPSPHHALLPPMPSSSTESWFAIRSKGSFATQSARQRTKERRWPAAPAADGVGLYQPGGDQFTSK
jgi:hypothetical protein